MIPKMKENPIMINLTNNLLKAKKYFNNNEKDNYECKKVF